MRKLKVALVAMNGIRLCDPEIRSEIQNWPGVVARLSALSSLPSLGLLTIAALIRDGAEVSYFHCPSLKEWDEPSGFDIVGISSYSAQIAEAYELAERYRKQNTMVVLGGTHVSALPNEAIERGYTAAIGEAELVWPEIMKDAVTGRLQQSYGVLGEVCDLSQSPVPAFDLLDPKTVKRIPIQTSRGCPHRCEFCAASVLISPKYRQKRIEQVLKEIDLVLTHFERPFIEFVDDNALADRNYWKILLRRLRERKIRWFAECDISIAQDDELLELMKQSGCREVLIGLESPIAEELRDVELNSNWKWKTQSLYRESLRKIQHRGIRVIGCFMLGLDNQHADSAQKIRDFVAETELFDVQITLQTAFPGTPLYARLANEGRLTDAADWNKCTLFDLNILPKTVSEVELVETFRALLKQVHGTKESSWRRRNFRKFLRDHSLTEV